MANVRDVNVEASIYPFSRHARRHALHFEIINVTHRLLAVPDLRANDNASLPCSLRL